MKKPTQKDFENRYEEAVTELLVLTKERLLGAGGYGGYLYPSLEFIASVDLQTGALSREKGTLEWLIKDTPDRKGWGYDFQQFEIYHIKARKNIPVKPLPYMDKSINNRYMVTEIVEEKVSEPRLDKIRKRISKPVRIEAAGIGSFELNRQFSSFEGEIEWLGAPCGVSLETDRADGATARRALFVLKELCANLEEWDGRLRRYAARELAGLSNEWAREKNGPDAATITEENLASRLKISEAVIAPDGDLTVYYKDDEVFYGHAVIVAANINGDISDAEIAG